MLETRGAPPLLSVRGLSKHYAVHRQGLLRRKTRLIRAVDDVSFDLAPGETLGLVGESGSGKTTAGRAILRAVEPTAGRVIFHDGADAVDVATLRGADLKRLRTRMQMIFQDPFSSLNPRMTVGDIVAEPLVIHRLARGRALRERVSAMLEKVGLKAEHRARYPHAFSGGQRQRIGIARALILDPAFIVADEAVSALDVSVQAQVINLLTRLQRELGLTCLFIAHDLSVVRHISDRVAVMYAGRLVETAPTARLFLQPRHPYTEALLASVPNPDPDHPMPAVIRGEVADPADLPAGCSFHPRCPRATGRCRADLPAMAVGEDGHGVRCFHPLGGDIQPPKAALPHEPGRDQ